MRKKKPLKPLHKLIVIIAFIQFLLVGYVLYAQSKCPPCAPDEPCPTCMSLDQVICLCIAGVMALVTLAYLMFKIRTTKMGTAML